jgi:hypothetical protein
MFNLKNKLNSTEGRKYIHHRLLTIARNANSVGKCKGLLGFIHEIDDENEIKKFMLGLSFIPQYGLTQAARYYYLQSLALW